MFEVYDTETHNSLASYDTLEEALTYCFDQAQPYWEWDIFEYDSEHKRILNWYTYKYPNVFFTKQEKK